MEWVVVLSQWSLYDSQNGITLSLSLSLSLSPPPPSPSLLTDHRLLPVQLAGPGSWDASAWYWPSVECTLLVHWWQPAAAEADSLAQIHALPSQWLGGVSVSRQWVELQHQQVCLPKPQWVWFLHQPLEGVCLLNCRGSPKSRVENTNFYSL